MNGRGNLAWCAFGMLALATTSCDRGDALAEGKGSTEAKKPDERTAPVAIAEAELGDIASHYVTTATLEAEKEAEVLARVQGVVRSIAREEGDEVKEGGLLLSIENQEYRLRLEQTEAKTAGLRDRHARVAAMVKQTLATTEELDTLRHDLASAEAEEGLARLAVAHTKVVAPFSGQVLERHVNVGQTVRDGTVLFRLADLVPLRALVHVPSKELKRLEVGQDVELRLDSTGTTLHGRITLVSPTIDSGTGTIKVTVEIAKYPPGTRAGDFAEVRIVTERRTNVVIIPRVAIAAEREESVVFVADGQVAKRKIVEVGFQQDDRAQILKGLDAGEKVIVKGQHTLKDGAPIRVVGS